MLTQIIDDSDDYDQYIIYPLYEKKNHMNLLLIYIKC